MRPAATPRRRVLPACPSIRSRSCSSSARRSPACSPGVNETLTFQNGNITLGSQYVFTGIAAAVIGGVLLTGGYGSPVGTMFGALTYGIVSLGVFFLGWNADLANFFVGLLLLLAVLANHRLRQLAMGRA